MVKVTGIDSTLSNAEVLAFVKNKRTQHAKEDAEDVAAGRTPASRPQNLMNSLEKAERHLKSDFYPYEKNPTAYAKDTHEQGYSTYQKLSQLHKDRIHAPASEALKEKVRQGVVTEKGGQEQWEVEINKKEFTDNEWLMIANHAPTTVEMLQPLIEQWDERFTVAELDTVVDLVKETYRADESGGAKEKSKEKTG